MRGPSVILVVKKLRNRSFFCQGDSLTGNSDSLASDGRWTKHTIAQDTLPTRVTLT